MIEDIYGRHAGKQIICDSCGDGFEADDWNEALQLLKEFGWTKVKVDGHFVHFCPDCASSLF